MSDKNGRQPRRGVLQKGALALGSGVLGTTLLSGTGATEPDEAVYIDECGNYDSGTYILEEDLEVGGDPDSSCLQFFGDVILDGNGHALTGDGSGEGVTLYGASLIRNLTIDNFHNGIYNSGSSLSLENTRFVNNRAAVHFETIETFEAHDVEFIDNGVALEEEYIALGGVYKIINSRVVDNRSGMFVLAGKVTVSDCVFANDSYGIFNIPSDMPIGGGQTVIERSEFKNHGESALKISLGSGKIRESTFTNNETGILVSPGDFGLMDRVTVENTNIVDNEAGIVVENLVHDRDFVVEAPCNYWGHATGPQHEDNPRNNPKGDKVSGNVEFSPWSVREIRDDEGTCVGGPGKK